MKMLILLARHKNMFLKKMCLSGMKYGFTTSKMTFLSNMTLKRMSKMFSKTLFMFVGPIIKQTKVHFKILELLVITFGTGR